ncbi:hypothetical protein [Rhodococcus koreensis]
MTTLDHDAAQARVFLDQLHAEIEILSERIEDAQARAQQARAVDRSLAERFRAEAAALRRQRYEAQQLVDGLVAGVPRGGQRRRHLAGLTARRIGTRCGGGAPADGSSTAPTPIGASGWRSATCNRASCVLSDR